MSDPERFDPIDEAETDAWRIAPTTVQRTDPAPPSPPVSFLDALAQRVYTKLELVSDVNAASLGQHVHQGKPGSKLLADDEGRREFAPAERFRRRYDGCRTDDSRRLVIREGLDEIKAIRYSRAPVVDCETQEGRLRVGRDTRPVAVVAHAYQYSERHIHNLRALAARHDAKNADIKRRWAA